MAVSSDTAGSGNRHAFQPIPTKSSKSGRSKIKNSQKRITNKKVDALLCFLAFVIASAATQSRQKYPRNLPKIVATILRETLGNHCKIVIFMLMINYG